MMFEKPVITSDIDSAREVCRDAGWYFNPKLAGNIYENIIKCYSSLQQRKEKTYRGRNLIREYPGWDQIAEKCLKSLES